MTESERFPRAAATLFRGAAGEDGGSGRGITRAAMADLRAGVRLAALPAAAIVSRIRLPAALTPMVEIIHRSGGLRSHPFPRPAEGHSGRHCGDGGLDAIDPIEPPPQGDVELAYVQQLATQAVGALWQPGDRRHRVHADRTVRREGETPRIDARYSQVTRTRLRPPCPRRPPTARVFHAHIEELRGDGSHCPGVRDVAHFFFAKRWAGRRNGNLKNVASATLFYRSSKAAIDYSVSPGRSLSTLNLGALFDTIAIGGHENGDGGVEERRATMLNERLTSGSHLPGAKSDTADEQFRQRVRSLRLPREVTANRPRGRWLPWLLCAILVGGNAALGYLYWSLLQQKADTPESRPTVASNAPANLVPVAPTSSASSGGLALEAKGYIIPTHQILVSPKVNGMVVKLRITESDRVKKGDVLAELEDTEYRTDRDRAEAGRLDSARRNLAELETAIAATKSSRRRPNWPKPSATCPVGGRLQTLQRPAGEKSDFAGNVRRVAQQVSGDEPAGAAACFWR